MKAIDEKAVSEVIGAVLLISVTVLGVAIVAVTYFSQPAPSEIPRVSVVAGATNTTFILSHEGGDALAKGSYRIYVDNGSGLEDQTDKFNLTGGGAWSIGENLTYTGTDTPQRVVISAVDLSGGETMIAELADVADMVDAGAMDAGVAAAGGYVDTGGSGSGSGSDPDPDPDPEESSFINYIIDENVFVYGNALQFSGNNVIGQGATVVITGDLDTADTNLGASINVSNIYIDGDVALNHGSAGLGSAVEPGVICVNGSLELWSGARDIYGDVYVAGNFRLKDAKIHRNVYVDGDLTLDWTPTLEEDTRIYYTGTITTPSYYSTDILAKCIHQTTVPGFKMPDEKIPSTKSADWYAARGYVPGGTLTSNMKVFADSYSSTSGNSANNVVIIAYDGDILITGGWSTVTGVFFAPNGKVTFDGASLEGVVIARDGFFATHGGSTVIFRNIEDYVSNSDDYPF